MSERTRIAGLRRWPGFLDGLWSIVADGTHDWTAGDRSLRAYHFWFRDHIHMVKFARFFDGDPVSALRFLVREQDDEGWFFEILTSSRDGHVNIVDRRFVRPLGVPLVRRGGGREPHTLPDATLVRLELEPDIEYLMVEAAARAEEAAGPDAGVEGMLPALERGILYSLTHPKRYEPSRGLVKRPFTIDTWDFAWGQSTGDRNILETTPMAIHYGDNAGVYAAARWLGERTNSAFWMKRAEEIRERTNALCWNGRFYTHQVLLDAVETGGPREEEILSLSNTYAVNRGLPDGAQAASIVESYLELRERTRGEAFAEWFTIYPPYPQFAVHAMWDYVNGGVAPFVGGELALAAFENGFEEYGVDILDRIHGLWRDTGTLQFLYTKDGGRPEHGWGPSGWGASAVGNALLAGLAGVRMDALRRRVSLTPRWAAAGESGVSVEAVYPASGFRASYRFECDPDAGGMVLEWEADGETEVSLLLPSGRKPRHSALDGEACGTVSATVRESVYVNLSSVRPRGRLEVALDGASG